MMRCGWCSRHLDRIAVLTNRIDSVQFDPVYEFHSERVDITFRLVDNYEVRNEILALLLRHSTAWFDAALTRAPTELQATLQVRARLRTVSAFIEGFYRRNI